ncbi:MAG TPA: hypothetical protein VLE53_15775 [Gemmatimonadaceae bacterium]|nr:hypothetical protein [Gemmatimonadaceae bacterium]
MGRVIRMAAMATMLGMGLAFSAEAQSRGAGSGFTRAARAAEPVVAQGQGGGAPMTFTLMGGVATGEGGFDLGLALSGSFEWDVRDWPVNLRVDPYFALHGGECGPFDCDLMLLGVGVNAAYNFPVTANAPQWFVFGGLGLYYADTDIDDDGFLGDDGEAETDLGIQIGGGLRFGGRYRLELRFMSVDSFDSIPILFGIRF